MMETGHGRKPSGRRNEERKPATSGDRSGSSFTPPHGDPERPHVGAEPESGAERTAGIFSELDGGGVQFGPRRPKPPSRDPGVRDLEDRGIDPSKRSPTVDEPRDPGDKPVQDPERKPIDETLDEQAMDQADEAGSALLSHDKVLQRRKRKRT
jgi:hypothetical protein